VSSKRTSYNLPKKTLILVQEVQGAIPQRPPVRRWGGGVCQTDVDGAGGAVGHK